MLEAEYGRERIGMEGRQMLFFDRFWGFRALAATLAAMSAIAFPLRYLALALPLDRQLGMSTNTDMLVAAGGAIALAAIALVLARGAALASARVERRRDIIDGHGATRHGIDAGHRTHASRHSSHPMVFIWRITVFDRAFAVFTLLLGIPTLVLTVLLFAAVVVDLSIGNAHTFRMLHSAISAILVFLPCGALTSWVFWSWTLQGLGKSLRISVDAEGINLRPRWGPERRIRWEDMRLLEISTYWQPEGRTLEKRKCFRLYSWDSAIRWPDDSASGATYIQRAQLLDMIEARTRLVPRDLSQRWLPLPAWRHSPRPEAE